jgi:hypothetical protein
MMRQKFFLKPKTFNPRISLRLYYTTDGSVFPSLKTMDGTRVTGTLTITPPGMIALSTKTDRSTREITINDILSVLDGAPDGVRIKPNSIVVPERKSVDSTLHYVGYGSSVVKLTLEKDGYTDAEITVTIYIVINYFSGRFRSIQLKKGDKIRSGYQPVPRGQRRGHGGDACWIFHFRKDYTTHIHSRQEAGTELPGFYNERRHIATERGGVGSKHII